MKVLERLSGGLIVSAQVWPGSALDDPRMIAAMAYAAQAGGAVAVRIAGLEQLRAVRERVRVPIVGLIKRVTPGFEPYITPTLDDARAILETGAEIVAFDATARPRPDGSDLASTVDTIHAAGGIALADCATAGDAVCAHGAGADILATTLCGYTEGTKGQRLPALDLVRELRQLDTFVLCEGGVHHPAELRAALNAGANAVCVGSAITNIDWLVRQFAGSADRRS